MTRGNRGGPSPFRFVLAPDGEAPKHVECSRRIQTLQGAKAVAPTWAGDVGAKGTLAIEERVWAPVESGTPWKSVAVADVVNSAIHGWR